MVLALVFHQFTARFLLTFCLRQSLGVPVETGRASVDFLRAEVIFKDVTIWNPEGFPPGVMVYIKELRMDSELSSLFQNGIHFQTVEADIDTLKLFRSSSGEVNFFKLKLFGSGPSLPFPEIFHTDSFVLSMGEASFYDESRVYREASADVDLRRMAYRNVRTLSDMAQITAWETLKKLRVTDVGKGYLDRIREELEGAAPAVAPIEAPRVSGWR